MLTRGKHPYESIDHVADVSDNTIPLSVDKVKDDGHRPAGVGGSTPVQKRWTRRLVSMTQEEFDERQRTKRYRQTPGLALHVEAIRERDQEPYGRKISL